MVLLLGPTQFREGSLSGPSGIESAKDPEAFESRCRNSGAKSGLQMRHPSVS